MLRSPSPSRRASAQRGSAGVENCGLDEEISGGANNKWDSYRKQTWGVKIVIFTTKQGDILVGKSLVFPCFSPNSVATLGVLTVAVKAGCSFEVVSSVPGKFGDHYSTNVPSWDVHVHFDCAGSRKPGVAETSRATLSSLCACRIALVVAQRRIGILCATLSALWACQIALAMARRSFWDCSRSRLLAVSDRSCGGAVLIVIIKEILCRDRDTEVSLESLRRDLDKRPLIDI